MIDYKRHVDVWINDVNLQAVAPLAVVQYVNEVTPEMDITTVDLTRPVGSLLTSRKRKSREVRIGCVIGNLYDLDLRAHNADAIAAWIRDGVLKVSYRPEQQLRVKAGRMPSLGNAREWTQNIEISFVAYALPYWEAAHPTELTLTAAAGAEVSGKIHPKGNADFAPLSVTVTNTGEGTLNAVTVSAAGRTIALSGLGIAAGDSVQLYHDDNMLFRIVSGTEQKTSCRSASSADELLVIPEADNNVSITADSAVEAVISTRGLWL